MNLRKLSRNLLVVLLAAAANRLLAQTPSPTQEPAQSQVGAENPGQSGDSTQDNQPPAQNETQEPSTRRPSIAPVPLPLNLDASSLQFGGEQAKSNFVSGGVGATASYDDNLLSQGSPRVGGFQYSVYPDIRLDISRPRLVLDTDYEGGYTFNQRFSAYNQSMQNAKVDLRYRLSPHVNLRLSDRFVLTTGFFNQLQAGESGLGSGIIQQPNIGVITPLARHLDNLGTAELTYQYSATDMVGGSATVDTSSFGAPPTGGAALVDTQSEDADAFYAHSFTPRNWSGIAYTFQRLTFDPVVESVNAHSFLLFHSVYLKPNTVLAVFAGPEYTQVDSQIVSTSVTPPNVTVTSVALSHDRWSVAGGASFNWQGRRTSFQAAGTRKVSDGGGLLTAVDVTSGQGRLRRQVTRSSTVEVGAIYTGSHALDAGATTFFSDLRLVSGSVLWEQKAGRNFSASFGYARDYQQESGPAVTTLNVNHNRGWVTIAYQFSRPLGR